MHLRGTRFFDFDTVDLDHTKSENPQTEGGAHCELPPSEGQKLEGGSLEMRAPKQELVTR